MLVIQVGQLAPSNIVLSDLHVICYPCLSTESAHIPTLSLHHYYPSVRLEFSQVDTSLHHPAQSPVLPHASEHVLIEARRYQVLVRLHQVRARLLVGHCAIELKAVSHRETRNGDLIDGIGQPSPVQLALLQCLRIERRCTRVLRTTTTHNRTRDLILFELEIAGARERSSVRARDW